MSWLPNNSSRRIHAADLHVDSALHPEWVSGGERSPAVGEQVYCTSGEAEVVRLLGKTGDGSRLLELKLPQAAAKPFFAAASNVLVAPIGISEAAPRLA
ncbi:MAG TPA: hypothetical protein VGR37_21080 [Longimicrobiaceae bacterium]|nr:hypothetical protein [Longimicrobiaceae bacterium]